MKKPRSATVAIVVFILSLSALIAFYPTAFASTTPLPGYTAMPDRPTQTEVGVSPNFVGVGQDVTVNIMTYPAPSGPTYEAQTLVPLLKGGFSGISITIRDPSGNENTFMPVDETLEQIDINEPGRAQIVGHLQFRYTPSQVGEYTLTASFPGEFYTTDNQYEPAKLSVYFLPSTSTKPAILTVQQEKVVESGLLTGWPWSPLPQNFWNNPVQINNREWAQISGDWIQTDYDIGASNYNPYSTAPNSPHILWAKEIGDGGLPGGIWGSLPYSSGSKTPVVLNGKIYQNSRSGYFECVDLRTGQKLWEVPGGIMGAQRIDPQYQTASQLNEGQIDEWLWDGLGTGFVSGGDGTWKRYDPFDGDLIQTIRNVPTDFRGIRYEDGNPVVFCVETDLSLWNTTLPLKVPYCNLIKWDLSKVSASDWRRGVVWNVSIMQDDFVSIADNNFHGPKVYPFPGADVVIVKTHNAMQIMAGYSYTTGEFLWKNNATVLNNDVRPYGIATSWSGPYIMHDTASASYVAYDVKTGREIWRTPEEEKPWAVLPAYTFVYHDGVHFIGSYDGHVYAYDTNTGQRIWQSDYVGGEWETIYGNQPFNGKAVGADGKLYYSSATTYRMMPRPRFHVLVCIDETTGQFKWKLPIGINPTAIADGYLLGVDDDNLIQYVVGKGKTETTVTAPDVAVSRGTSLLIKGKVLDMSPGAPNTPAVSDEDMSEWMSYLYGQNATLINTPPSPNGVLVTLRAVGSDGAIIDIGQTTTNGFYGTYAQAWTPPKEDTYQIIATFEGSESYWSSTAATAVTVGSAVTNGGTPSTEVPDNTMTIIGVGVALAIVVIVAVAVAVLILKKK